MLSCFFLCCFLSAWSILPIQLHKTEEVLYPWEGLLYLLKLHLPQFCFIMTLSLLSFTQHHVPGNWLPGLCHGLMLVPPCFHPHFAVLMSLDPSSLGSAAIRPRFLPLGEVIKFQSPASPLMLACLIREPFIPHQLEVDLPKVRK